MVLAACEKKHLFSRLADNPQNEISNSLSSSFSAALALTFTVSLALRADVVAEHRAEHEVFFGREQVERSCLNHAYGVKALLSAELQVQAVVANGLYDVFYVLAFQSAYGKVLVFLVEREEHHTAHSLLVFVDMVHQNLHVYW